MSELQDAIDTLMKARPPKPPDESLRGRGGRFRVSDSILEDESAALEVISIIMSRVFIVRCEHDYMRGVFAYDAYSMDFEPLREGEDAPTYHFEIERDESGVYRFTGVKRKP